MADGAALAAAARSAPWLRRLAWLVVLPAAFLYSGLFQLYPLPGWVDPGIYLGYFLDLPGLVARYGFGVTTYHGTRLSWVVPGYLLHQWLPPVPAQLALVATMYFPSVWAAYAAGKGLGGRLGGHLAAASLAYNPLFVAAVAFGAVDGMAVTYLMLSAAALFAPTRRPLAIARGAAFGILAGLAAVAHPFAAPLAVFLAIGYVIVHAPAWRRLAAVAGAAVAGGVLTYVAVGSVSLLFGGRFLFHLDSMGMVNNALRAGIGYSYRLPIADWLFASYRVLIPTILLAMSIVWVARSRRQEGAQRQVAALAMLAASWLMFPLFDIVFGGVTLQARNYTNLVLPACTLAVAALVQGMRDQPRDRGRWPILALLVAPGLAVAALDSIEPAWLAGPGPRLAVFSVLVLAGFGCTVAMALGPRVRRAAVLAALAVCSACAALNQDSANVYVARTGVQLRDAYLGAQDLVAFVRSEPDLRKRQLLLWYARDAFTTGMPAVDRQLAYHLRYRDRRYEFTYYDTLSSLFLYDRSLLGEAFPALDDTMFSRNVVDIDQASPIILISQRPQDLGTAARELERRGFQVRVHRTMVSDHGPYAYTAWMLELCAAGRKRLDGTSCP